jgi:hypothetical protein
MRKGHAKCEPTLPVAVQALNPVEDQAVIVK